MDDTYQGVKTAMHNAMNATEVTSDFGMELNILNENENRRLENWWDELNGYNDRLNRDINDQVKRTRRDVLGLIEALNDVTSYNRKLLNVLVELYIIENNRTSVYNHNPELIHRLHEKYSQVDDGTFERELNDLFAALQDSMEEVAIYFK